MNKEEEPTLHGFIARLQTKSDSGELSYIERKYIEAIERVEKKENKTDE